MFIIFLKPAGKHFSVYASLFDRVTQVAFTSSFFIGYSRLLPDYYHKRTLARVPVNFEKFLTFIAEHPKANTFAPFRSL